MMYAPIERMIYFLFSLIRYHSNFKRGIKKNLKKLKTTVLKSLKNSLILALLNLKKLKTIV